MLDFAQNLTTQKKRVDLVELKVGGNSNSVSQATLELQLGPRPVAMGVADDRIDDTDRCTYRDRTEFFSHRRDNGVTGRMAALIGVKAER